MTENDVDEDVCVRCTPSVLPDVFQSDTRTGLFHVGVRFGDGGRARVWLDGIDVTGITWEAIAGDPGYVLVTTEGPHSGHIPIALHCGVVRVELVMEPW